jgi:hypothetical protein
MKFTRTDWIGLIFILGIMLLCWTKAYGQTCSTTNPCVPIKVTDNNAPPATTDVATLLQCGGTCTAASLAAYMSAPTQPSPWSVVASFPMTVNPRQYNQPQAYSTLISYAAYITPSGGTAGLPSAIATFQNGPPPAQVAPGVTVPSTSSGIITSGSTGPQ